MSVIEKSKTEAAPTALIHARPDRYRVSVEEYITFRRTGFLVVPTLVAPDEIEELRDHTEDLMNGRLPQQQVGYVTAHSQKFDAPPAHLSKEEKAQYFLRI